MTDKLIKTLYLNKFIIFYNILKIKVVSKHSKKSRN